MLKKYIYSGPTSSVTLSEGDEHSLFDGKTYDLPPDNLFVASLIRQRRLKEVPGKENKPAKAKKDPPKTKSNEQENA